MLVKSDKIPIKTFIQKFEDTYKTFLLQNVYGGDEQMVAELFKDKKIKKLISKVAEGYFQSIYEFYDKKPNGTFLEESNYLEQFAMYKVLTVKIKLSDLINEYVNKTNDENLSKFLKIYAYCLENHNGTLHDINNNFLWKNIDKYFEKAEATSMSMYQEVQNDIEAKNIWWVKDTASTLRRALEAKLQYVSNSRMQNMINKYCDKKVNYPYYRDNPDKREFNLITELDFSMLRKYNALPSYFWRTEKGALTYDLKPPESGSAYSFVLYQNYTRTKEGDKGRGHAL